MIYRQIFTIMHFILFHVYEAQREITEFWGSFMQFFTLKMCFTVKDLIPKFLKCTPRVMSTKMAL